MTFTQAFQRLNRLGLCLSHARTLQLVKSFSVGHDAEVLKWKLKLEHMAICDEGESPLPDELDTDTGESSESIEEEEALQPLTGILCSLHTFSYQIFYVINSSPLIESETEESSSDSQDSMQSGYTGDQSAASCSKSLRCSYVLVGDNIDKAVTARHMTMDHQSQSLHYFHCYAALDRIDFHDLDNSSPIGNVGTLPLEIFLPSMEDCDALRNNYVVLLAREIVDKVPYFEVFADSVPGHIVHQYTEELSCKSSIVSLYCIRISTNKTIHFLLLYPYAYFRAGSPGRVAT